MVRTTNTKSTVRAPATDVYETESSYLLLAELPGVSREGLQVDVEGREVRILGTRDEQFGGGDFRRTFILGPGLRGDAVEGSLSNGVLRLEIPKAVPARRRVDVATA